MKKYYDIIGAPFGFGANKYGSTDAPNYLRQNGLNSKISQRIKNWNSMILDNGNLEVNSKISDYVSSDKKSKAVAEYSNALKDKILESFNNDNTPIILGGDHTITIGTLAASSSFLKSKNPDAKLGVIWVDAHADLNYLEDGNIHGKSAAIALGELYKENDGYKNLINSVEKENIFFISLRDIMPHEMKFIKENNISFYGMDKIEEKGIIQIIEEILEKLETTTDGVFLSFDIDACDGSIFQGCGTPEIGGLTAREALEITYRVGQSKKFLGADIVEFSPEDDKNNLTCQLVIKLIDGLFGFRY